MSDQQTKQGRLDFELANLHVASAQLKFCC